MERGAGMPGPIRVTQPINPEDIAIAIDRLSNLPLKELRVAWRAEFRREPPKGLWRNLLLRTLSWRLQEKAFGGHDKATLEMLKACSQNRPGDTRSQQLKPGTVLIRDFEGVRHTVTIMPKGYVWQDRTYASLTAIAKIITGTNWNGPRFFGLREGRFNKGSASREVAA